MLLHEADVEWTYRRLLISGVETTGTVVSIEKGRISHPIFEYVVEHRIYRVRSNQSRYLRASEKTPKIGDTITVV
ncbi:MAG: hypothetical protein NDI61_09100, partial [Bdellovibrionaceae bacterium]|nr:hypothetical protein [Pseudobdellovibrionaceae bacterium]